jgi:uncharacterized protein YbcI
VHPSGALTYGHEAELGHIGITEVTMKSQVEIEVAIREGMSRFEQEYIARGLRDIHVQLIGDLVVIRLQAVLTEAQQQLVKALPAQKGRDLLKQVRTNLIETARARMQATIQEVTGVRVLTWHHDISTATGEDVVLLTLGETPLIRETGEQ